MAPQRRAAAAGTDQGVVEATAVIDADVVEESADVMDVPELGVAPAAKPRPTKKKGGKKKKRS